MPDVYGAGQVRVAAWKRRVRIHEVQLTPLRAANESAAPVDAHVDRRKTIQLRAFGTDAFTRATEKGIDGKG